MALIRNRCIFLQYQKFQNVKKFQKRQYGVLITILISADNAVKSSRAVYEKRFLENQIMRKREFFDTNGRVIGLVSTIKCIYLY